jgi:ATP-dependent RNA helicase RhlE
LSRSKCGARWAPLKGFMSTCSFSDLALIEPLVQAVAREGYTVPTPIQEKAIPTLLAGHDLLGCAQTGTGKTAAFALPILQLLNSSRHPLVARSPRALVLAPTRELAAQIEERFSAYGRDLPLRGAVVYGGVGKFPQIKWLARGVDILIATPGRLLDLMHDGHVRLDRVEIFVLDEADRMLDMGFIRDIRKIVPLLPTKRQSVFFSATLPPDICELANRILNKPVRVEVTPVSSTVDLIDQRVMFVDRANKRALLGEVLKDRSVKRALVFSRTKHGANKLAGQLERMQVRAEAIHANKSQGARTRALENFREGHTRVLVATDIAARGIDVDGISHVINFDIPNVPECYVHRIGRTGRAGATGVAISFCDREERSYLRDIERLIQRRVAVVHDHPHASGAAG